MKKIYNEDYYMYRLCNIKGIGRASVRKLVDFFGSAYNVSKADINILKKTGILNGRQIEEFAFSMKNKDNIYKYEDMIKNGWNWQQENGCSLSTLMIPCLPMLCNVCFRRPRKIRIL